MPRPTDDADFPRLDRPPSLAAQVERLLRQAIAEGRFADGRLPTEVELAEQIGVSRETIRLAAEVLQREGLLVKVRRRGTFLAAPRLPQRLETSGPGIVGYLQASYQTASGQSEPATRSICGLMLQGALEEAGRQGVGLLVHHAPHTQIARAFRQLPTNGEVRGVIFAHFGEEKLLRRIAGLGLPLVLLDHDLSLPGVHSVRDDSADGARQAVRHLAELGHRRIGFVNWRQTDLNPWRLEGYRRGLREAGLPRRRAWELAVELTEAGARRAVGEFLALAPRPTGLYCFNNTLARLVLAELTGRGVRIPQDVSLIGGGGEDVPGFACHQTDWHAMGRAAVQLAVRDAGQRREAVRHLGSHSLYPGWTATAYRSEIG